MDHDRLFKLLLTTFFVEFIELFLPDVSKYLDRNSLQFLDKEIFTDIASGERHEVDLVVKARFRGKQTFFLIHIENQAHSQTGLCRRIFEYFGLLHNMHRLPVLPVVVAYLKLTASETIVYNRELAATAPSNGRALCK